MFVVRERKYDRMICMHKFYLENGDAVLIYERDLKISDEYHESIHGKQYRIVFDDFGVVGFEIKKEDEIKTRDKYYEVNDRNLFYHAFVGRYIKTFPSGAIQLEFDLNEDLGGKVKINFYRRQLDIFI